MFSVYAAAPVLVWINPIQAIGLPPPPPPPAPAPPPSVATQATWKLLVANACLRLMKEGSLTQNELTNNTREPARLFNAVWEDGGIDDALEAGQWKFAKRVVRLDASPSIEPSDDFGGGYQFAFEKPDDFVRIVGMWTDANMQQPLGAYREENGFWVASQESIYCAYVSSDLGYGYNYGAWPKSFQSFVHAHFAAEIAGPLTSQGKELIGLRKLLLREALAIDGMADPTRFMPPGNWSASRRASMFSRHEQGR